MNRNYSQPGLSALVLLLAVVACVLPGQTLQPAPVTNPITIETAVAGTALAAGQQTQQALPATTTPVPTDVPTATPRISSVGTSLLNLADGSIQFTDHVAGVKVTFSSLWLVFRLGETEFFTAWGRPEVQNPEYVNIFSALQNNDPKLFRVHALDIRAGHAPYGVPTIISAVFLAEDTRSLKELEKEYRNLPPPCSGYKILSSSYPQTSDGTRVLAIEKRCEAASNGGYVYFKQVYFSLPSGIVHLDLETHYDYKDSMVVEFDQVVNSVTAINP